MLPLSDSVFPCLHHDKHPIFGGDVSRTATSVSRNCLPETSRWSAGPLLLLLLLLLSACLPLEGQSIPNRDRLRARFLEMAYKAKTAQLAGQNAKAQHLWRQARPLSPHPTSPGWLDSLPPARIPADPVDQRAALLASATENLDSRCIVDLEDWLIRYPWDTEVRLLLLAEARKTGNGAMERRHSSFLGKARESRAGKMVLAAILMVLLVWQARELLSDLRRTRG